MKINSINRNLAARLKMLEEDVSDDSLIAIRGCINIKELVDYDVSASVMQLAICKILADDYYDVLSSMGQPLAAYYQNKFLVISQRLEEVTEKNRCKDDVRLSYGDVAFLICMLHDYLPAFQNSCDPQISSWSLIIQEVMEMLSQQIGYDYEAVLEHCLKKRKRIDPENDIGGDGLSQAYFKAKREQAYKEKQKEKNNHHKK